MEIRQNQADTQAEIFPFFALPAELRMAVYFELLVSSDRVLPTWRGPRRATKQQKKMFISILLTCKQCRDEGVEVLYGENVFDFGEICNRPNNFSSRFVKTIGLHNASLIRVVFAEYSAAAEELSTADTKRIERMFHDPKPKATLTVAFLRDFLSTCGIDIPSLRMLAVSVMPYGHDQATEYLIQLADEAVRHTKALQTKWLEAKNDAGRMGRMVEGISEREEGLLRADYWRDIDAWIGITFSPPSSGREWLVYRGVRGKEDKLLKEENSPKEESLSASTQQDGSAQSTPSV